MISLSLKKAGINAHPVLTEKNQQWGPSVLVELREKEAQY